MKINNSLEGLRGIAAISVVISHFITVYYPTLLHNTAPINFPKEEYPSLVHQIMEFPLFALFYDGSIAVIIFFVLSGYVLTRPAFKNNQDKLKERLWGRYLRLNIPVAISLIFAFILLKLNLMYNTQIAQSYDFGKLVFAKYYFDTVSWQELANTIFYKSILQGDSTLNTPLWTIQIEFIGSLYLLAFYIIKPNINNIKIDFILLLILFLYLYIFYHESALFLYALFLGSILNYIGKPTKKALYVTFLIGIYFTAFRFNNVMYNFLPEITVNENNIFEKKMFYNTIGATFIVFSIINGFAKSLLSSNIALYFGKISFSVYLLHFPLLCSFSAFMFLNFPHTLFYMAINFILYFTVVIMISHYFMKYIDRFAINISHKFVRKFFSNDNKF